MQSKMRTRVSRRAWVCFGAGILVWGLAVWNAYDLARFERAKEAARKTALATSLPGSEPEALSASGVAPARSAPEWVRRVAGTPQSPLARDLRAREAKYSIRNKYASLYAQLRLSPEQRERFEQVLLEQLDAADLVLSGVLGAPPQLEKRRYDETYRALEAAMASAAGPEAAATLREYAAYGEIRETLMAGVAETYYDQQVLAPADVEAIVRLCQRLQPAPETGRPLKVREIDWQQALREGRDQLSPAAIKRIGEIAAIAEFDREYWRLTGNPVRPIIRGW